MSHHPLANRTSAPTDNRGSKVSARRIPVFLILLLWIFSLLVVFYIFHKPLPAQLYGRMRDVLIDVLAAVWIVGIGIGIGRWISDGSGLSFGERIALAGAFGLGILSLGVMLIAWAGILYAPLILAAFAVLTILLAIPIVRDVVRRRKLPQVGLSAGSPFSLLLWFFLAAALLLSLGIALAPPTAWDSLVYHLRIPQQMVASHSLQPTGDSLFWEIPHAMETIYASAIALTGRSETAAVVGWFAGLLTLIGMTGAARRWGWRYPALPAVLLLSGDTLAKSLGWGYVDWAAALFGFVALCALSRKGSGLRWVLLAGGFAGLATGVKYTAGVILPVMILALIPGRPWRNVIKEAALLLVGCVVAFSPWVIWSLVAWGNPLPPFLDSGAESVLRARFFAGQPLPNGWIWMLAMPILQSTIGSYGAWPFGATIGSLLLAFLPGALLARKEESPEGGLPIRMFWLCGAAFWAAAGLGGLRSVPLTQPRLYMALLPGIALLSAYGFECLGKISLGRIRLGAIASTLTVLVLAIQGIGLAQSWTENGIPDYFAGSLDRTAYLERNLGWYMRSMEYINALPDGTRVLMLWEPRGLYCVDKCQEDATLDRWYLAMRRGTAEATLAEWRQEGWTHILIFNAGAEFERAGRVEYAASDWTELDRLRSMLTVEAGFGTDYTLYRIPPLHRP